MPMATRNTITWEEGSHLNKEYTYEATGGTGKYQGVKGSGTYVREARPIVVAFSESCGARRSYRSTAV